MSFANDERIIEIDSSLLRLLDAPQWRTKGQEKLDESVIETRIARIKKILDQKITARGPGAINDHSGLFWPVIDICGRKKQLLPVLEVFLQAGMDPAAKCKLGRNGLHIACAEGIAMLDKYDHDGSMRNVKTNLDFGAHTPLSTRASKTVNFDANLDEMQQLLAMGEDPNVRNADWNAPLHLVLSCELSDESKLRATALLLKAGANPNAVGGEGQTPLGILCASKQFSGTFAVPSSLWNIGLLLEHGAKPCIEAGQLHKIAWKACILSDVGVLGKTLELGLDRHCEQGKFLLFEAASSEKENAAACTKLLLDHGWDPFCRNERGETLLESEITEPARAVVLSHLAAKEAGAAMATLAQGDRVDRPMRAPFGA